MIVLTILAASMYLSIKAVNTVFGFLLKKMFPFTTPCLEQNNRNRKFYDDTEYILRVLVTEDTVRKCLGSEEEVEIYLNDNTLEIHKKKDGYTQKTPNIYTKLCIKLIYAQIFDLSAKTDICPTFIGIIFYYHIYPFKKMFFCD